MARKCRSGTETVMGQYPLLLQRGRGRRSPRPALFQDPVAPQAETVRIRQMHAVEDFITLLTKADAAGDENQVFSVFSHMGDTIMALCQAKTEPYDQRAVVCLATLRTQSCSVGAPVEFLQRLMLRSPEGSPRTLSLIQMSSCLSSTVRRCQTIPRVSKQDSAAFIGEVASLSIPTTLPPADDDDDLRTLSEKCSNQPCNATEVAPHLYIIYHIPHTTYIA